MGTESELDLAHFNKALSLYQNEVPLAHGAAQTRQHTPLASGRHASGPPTTLAMRDNLHPRLPATTIDSDAHSDRQWHTADAYRHPRRSAADIFDTSSRRLSSAQPHATRHSLADLAYEPRLRSTSNQTLSVGDDVFVDRAEKSTHSNSSGDSGTANVTPPRSAPFPPSNVFLSERSPSNVSDVSPLAARASVFHWPLRTTNTPRAAPLSTIFDGPSPRMQFRRPSDTAALEFLRRPHGTQRQRLDPDTLDDLWERRPPGILRSPTGPAAAWRNSHITQPESTPIDPLVSDEIDPLAPVPDAQGGAALRSVPASTTPVFAPEIPQKSPAADAGYGTGGVFTLPYTTFIPTPYPIPVQPPRAFVIKSFNDTDVRQSLEYGVWTSTKRGNQRLDSAWHTSGGAVPIYLFFSVNGSGKFCGVAQMISAVDYDTQCNIWTENHWTGCFRLQWLLVKDVPNRVLRHIILKSMSQLTRYPGTEICDPEPRHPGDHARRDN